jgi:hypothetical protein
MCPSIWAYVSRIICGFEGQLAAGSNHGHSHIYTDKHRLDCAALAVRAAVPNNIVMLRPVHLNIDIVVCRVGTEYGLLSAIRVPAPVSPGHRYNANRHND